MALADHFARNIDSTAEDSFASFLAPDDAGIQLVIAGSALDYFCRFGELLKGNSSLRAGYDAVKQAHVASGFAAYREAKRRYIEQALGTANRTEAP